MTDRAHVRKLLARLDDLDVRDVFVVAGDVGQPAGEFEGAAPLLAAIAEVGHGLDEIGITGYPESHALISDETTIQAMFDKAPLATYIVSQICFEPEVIGTWIRRVRDRGVDLPIHIGLPGPVAASTLARFAGASALASPRASCAPAGWGGCCSQTRTVRSAFSSASLPTSPARTTGSPASTSTPSTR